MIKGYLKIMLSYSTEKEWSSAYSEARLRITIMPLQLELLDTIYINPKYYSGYYIPTLFCNLKCLGSVTAEQNHASNVIFLGKGASWSLAEQISHLMERQQHHHKRNMRLEYLSLIHISEPTRR